MTFGWWNFQMVGLEQVTDAETSIMFGLVLSVCISTVALVTMNFQTNKHPPLATSSHPLGPSASSTNHSPAKNLALHYKTIVRSGFQN